MRPVYFARAAQLDLDAIDDYTTETFGLKQAQRVTAAFREACDTLAMFPHAGPVRPDLSPHGRTFRFYTVMQRFVIAYETRESSLYIARILHDARHLADELSKLTPSA